MSQGKTTPPSRFDYAFGLRVANTLIRLGSLGSKLLFALYMGRYLGLSEMGTYGLISAYIAIMVTLTGMCFDYVVSRDIVDATPLEVTCKIRDEMAFYGLNYIALAVALALLMAGPLKQASPHIMLFAFILTALESFAAITSGNIISLKQPVFSNVLFFIRAAAWTIPAMALGIFFPRYRTADAILLWWMGGVLLSLLITFIAWRDWPWAQAMRVPINWRWIKSGLRKCAVIWLGSIGAALALYVDRFVVEHFLAREYVGIISFYGSFTNSIQSLLHSSVFAFSYPRLMSRHRQGNKAGFRHEVWRMSLQAAFISGFMALCVGVAVPQLGRWFHRPEFAQYSPLLWMLLLGVWLRASTDSLYYALYARHQDRLVSIGGLLALIPAFCCNMALVPLMGLMGIGYSAIITAVFICAWRFYSVSRIAPQHMEPAQNPPLSFAEEIKEENF